MGAWKDLFIFFGLIVVLFVLWISLGGPQAAPKQPVGTASNISSPSKTREASRGDFRDPDDLALDSTASPYKDIISFSGGSPQRELVSEEWIRIRSSSRLETPANITGWRVESVITGNYAIIPGAAALPAQGVVNAEAPLLLAPSNTAILHSGRSPIGVSFRNNMCAGYLDPRDRFHPRLRRQCPQPEDEFKNFGFAPNKTRDEAYEKCKRFVRRYIDRCEVTREELDEKDEDIELLPLSSQCVAFIENNLTYPGCVANHFNDDNFFDNEWRVFLGSGTAELWRKNDEILRLLDAQGRVVDVWQY